MFTKFANFEAKMTKNAAGGVGGGGGGGPDYGAMMADLINMAAQKQFEAAEHKEPAKANRTITQG